MAKAPNWAKDRVAKIGRQRTIRVAILLLMGKKRRESMPITDLARLLGVSNWTIAGDLAQLEVVEETLKDMGYQVPD